MSDVNKMSVEKAQALLVGYKFRSDGEAHAIFLLAHAYIAQAAELARLRAKVEAGDRLEEAANAVFYSNEDWHPGMAELQAALTAYKGAGE